MYFFEAEFDRTLVLHLACVGLRSGGCSPETGRTEFAFAWDPYCRGTTNDALQAAVVAGWRIDKKRRLATCSTCARRGNPTRKQRKWRKR